MNIEISNIELRRGVRKSHNKCPFILALKKVLKRSIEPSTDGAFLFLHYDWRPTDVIPLPEELIDWLYDYDWGRKVEARGFNIDLHPKTLHVRPTKALIRR